MAAASVPGIHGWDNAYYAWPCGALGLSAFPGGRRGPGVPVRCGRPVAGSAPLSGHAAGRCLSAPRSSPMIALAPCGTAGGLAS